jgi:hypothetical protein
MGNFAFAADDLSEEAIAKELHHFTRNTVQFNSYFQDNLREDYLRANEQFIRSMNAFTALPQHDINETLQAFLPQSAIYKMFAEADHARYRALEIENIETLTLYEQRFKNLLEHNKANESFLSREGDALRQEMQKWTQAEKKMAGLEQKILNWDLYVSELDAEIANRIRIRSRRGRLVREEMSAKIDRLKLQRAKIFEARQKYAPSIKYETPEKAKIGQRYARWLRMVSDSVMAERTHSVLESALRAQLSDHKGVGTDESKHKRKN